MNSASVNWFFTKLKNDNQCLLYNGSFSDDVTFKLVTLSEANLKNYNEGMKTQRRVSYLMAECFQNIIRHGEKELIQKDSQDETSFFMTRYSSGKYYIISANLIKNDNIEDLKQQLDQLNKLDEEELKTLYKKVIRYGEISDKGGAGLGLIEMARKSGHELGYSFVDFSKDSSIFYNQIVLQSEFEQTTTENDNKLGIESASVFHELLRHENILMIQKGDFSQESILPVLNIIENSILSKGSKSMKMKNVYIAMVELLQNISKHTFSTNEIRDGIFTLSKKQKNFMVCTGNYIENDKVTALKSHLDKINSLNKDELELLYSEILMNDLDNESDNSGLGLINLAQISLRKFEFHFEKIDAQKSIFTIASTV
ncbi:MAG: SiaB family protein kinase [Salinivirgaceae bacterium]|jgi:hypothetical protein|nr:SiaB family protein kinase [Salinivirgaceae bacterium]